jgi:2-oxoisovalerate dehydrogenase E1 component beta subunit
MTPRRPVAEADKTVRAAQKQAEAQGILPQQGFDRIGSMFEDVYADTPGTLPNSATPRSAKPAPTSAGTSLMPNRNMIEAINDAHRVTMARDPDIVVFGEDVGYFGGVFRATAGLQKEFGKTRCFDAPISEGRDRRTAVGMAAYGLKPVIEIQFADYIYPGYDQIVSEVARMRYRTRASGPCRWSSARPMAAASSAARPTARARKPVHPRRGPEGGDPSTPYDAKGLLIAAIEDPDPRLFFEPKRIYNGPFDGHHDRPVKPWAKHPDSEVPDGHYTFRSARRRWRGAGEAVTILAYGTMVHVAIATAEAEASTPR